MRILTRDLSGVGVTPLQMSQAKVWTRPDLNSAQRFYLSRHRFRSEYGHSKIESEPGCRSHQISVKLGKISSRGARRLCATRWDWPVILHDSNRDTSIFYFATFSADSCLTRSGFT